MVMLSRRALIGAGAAFVGGLALGTGLATTAPPVLPEPSPAPARAAQAKDELPKTTDELVEAIEKLHIGAGDIIVLRGVTEERGRALVSRLNALCHDGHLRHIPKGTHCLLLPPGATIETVDAHKMEQIGWVRKPDSPFTLTPGWHPILDHQSDAIRGKVLIDRNGQISHEYRLADEQVLHAPGRRIGHAEALAYVDAQIGKGIV